MKVYRNLDLLPSFVNPVVTIGTFDGVHLGHQQILSHLKNEALAIQGETVVITFHPHPRNIVGDTTGVQLLTTLEEKITLLEAANINHLVVIPFDDVFANQSAEEYVINFLYRKFKPHTFIIGYDHRFGNKRTGDYQLLEKLGNQLGFIVKEIPQQLLNNATISSTQIRKAMLQADLKTASALLGYSYFFSGIVIRGDQIGRTIGYPTANIQLLTNEKLVPGDGVYAVSLINKSNKDNSEKILKGMMYIGSRPVVNGKRRVIEVNIFDFNQDIYDSEVEITLHQWIRGDVHFNGLEALKNQLAIDQIHSLEALSIIG
jgi:riboflavin kinase/FMN adenylyltransferase